MTDVDKRLFPADSRNFNWQKFIYPYFSGMRVYVLLDPMDTYSKSKKKLRKLKYIHYTFKFLLITILIVLLYILIIKRIMDLF